MLGACRVRFILSLEGEKARENEGVEDVLGARRVRFRLSSGKSNDRVGCAGCVLLLYFIVSDSDGWIATEKVGLNKIGHKAQLIV